MARYPKAFAERNKVVIAVVGLVTLSVVFLATFNANSLPVIGGGKVYTAQFAEAGGLKSGNEVRVAGVKVGEVSGLSLDGTTVEVRFRAKGVDLGDQTRASIKVKTMLGQKFLSLDPLGTGELDDPIPVSRTTTPYDVNAAFSDLSETIGEIDTQQMEASFTALADAFRDTPESVQGVVRGLTDLSRTISSRDEELAQLFSATADISGTLKDRNAEFARLINDGSSLLEELENRRETIRAMLQGTARLGTELEGLVRDNEEQLRPALAKLDEVAAILQRNQDNLESAIKQMGPYYRGLAAATGNGRWVDSYICGLFDEQGAPVLDNSVDRDCTPGGQR
ncbi:ABC transporter substrate-binding protein [Aeromicrobium sp. PE09-221]|uniref:MCE family protein n=1 Tax=Aeromicrobium sp. PE09-221 TaxID=1898043 RepID=UPI000B3E414F|nr:MCE family protein [Aeromicrobium sp. PE09-221]OUZ07780.1 ABC transporter substrate-binding protein [Aeromicrobium sp. PE09-221]